MTLPPGSRPGPYVYQRQDDRLIPREFAFSLDNLRPSTLNSWFCLHDDEHETFRLAALVGMLRADDSFARDFDTRLDALLESHGIWRRQDDGSLIAPPQQSPASEWLASRVAINDQLRADGFVARAVSILKSQGLPA